MDGVNTSSCTKVSQFLMLMSIACYNAFKNIDKIFIDDFNYFVDYSSLEMTKAQENAIVEEKKQKLRLQLLLLSMVAANNFNDSLNKRKRFWFIDDTTNKIMIDWITCYKYLFL